MIIHIKKLVQKGLLVRLLNVWIQFVKNIKCVDNSLNIESTSAATDFKPRHPFPSDFVVKTCMYLSASGSEVTLKNVLQRVMEGIEVY